MSTENIDLSDKVRTIGKEDNSLHEQDHSILRERNRGKSKSDDEPTTSEKLNSFFETRVGQLLIIIIYTLLIVLVCWKKSITIQLDAAVGTILASQLILIAVNYLFRLFK